MLLYKMVAAGFVVVDGAVVVGPPTEAVASEEVAAPKLSQDELSRFATLLKELQTLEDAQCPSVPVISGAISDTPKHWHFRRWKNDVIEDSYFSRAESQYIETAFHAYLSGSGPRKIYFYSGQDGTDVYEINFQPLRSDLGQLSAIQDQNDWSDADQRKHLQVFNRVLLNNRSHPNDPESWHFTYTNIRTGKDQKSSPSRLCVRKSLATQTQDSEEAAAAKAAIRLDVETFPGMSQKDLAKNIGMYTEAVTELTEPELRNLIFGNLLPAGRGPVLSEQRIRDGLEALIARYRDAHEYNPLHYDQYLALDRDGLIREFCKIQLAGIEREYHRTVKRPTLVGTEGYDPNRTGTWFWLHKTGWRPFDADFNARLEKNYHRNVDGHCDQIVVSATGHNDAKAVFYSDDTRPSDATYGDILKDNPSTPEGSRELAAAIAEMQAVASHSSVHFFQNNPHDRDLHSGHARPVIRLQVADDHPDHSLLQILGRCSHLSAKVVFDTAKAHDIDIRDPKWNCEDALKAVEAQEAANQAEILSHKVAITQVITEYFEQESADAAPSPGVENELLKQIQADLEPDAVVAGETPAQFLERLMESHLSCIVLMVDLEDPVLLSSGHTISQAAFDSLETVRSNGYYEYEVGYKECPFTRQRLAEHAPKNTVIRDICTKVNELLGIGVT